MKCRHCMSEMVVKNGSNYGSQRYLCRMCGKTFIIVTRKYSSQTKLKAIEMYLNNVGIRKIALFLNTSPTLVSKWIKGMWRILSSKLVDCAHSIEENQSEPDIIEMDEIYTFVKKNSNAQSSGLLILDDKVVLLRLK